MLGAVLGLIILVLDIWAVVNIMGSSISAGSKALWVVLVLVAPVIGLIAWLLVGPRDGSARVHS